jgi:predicted metal-dependent hydrolase
MNPAPEFSSIQLASDQPPIHYSVKISKRASRYRITISSEGVQVILPKGSHSDQAPDILRAHATWVHKQIQRMNRHPIQKLPRDVILLQGQPFRVVFSQVSATRPTVRLERDRSIVHIRAPQGAARHAFRILESWLREQSRPLIEKQVRYRSGQVGVQPVRVTIRDQRTRWGSCSSRGTLSFNWRLIMAPAEVMDYVVIHELCHLLEPNHSRRFWQQVAALLPNFREPRLWLKRNASLLRPFQ